MKKSTVAVIATAFALAGASGALYALVKSGEQPYGLATPTVTQEGGKTVKHFELAARETAWKLDDDTEVAAWTYNGSVPGSEIRVQQGDIVRVTLRNELPVPTSIHWHGYPVPNAMDGIPGVTQNAVRPGETFTYEFAATVPGTYWYHSHQDSSNQVDRGLYGTLVVEAKQDQALDRDYTLVLDEWNPAANGSHHSGMHHGSSSGHSSGMNHGSMNHEGMNHASMGNSDEHGSEHAGPEAPGLQANMPPGALHDEMMKAMYTVYMVNGKSGKGIQPLRVSKGDRVRLRFVNAGFQSHVIHLHGQPYMIVSTDGQPIASPQTINDQPFVIGPGERYDIEFVANGDSGWIIESHDPTEAAKGMVIPVEVDGAKAAPELAGSDKSPLPVDLTAYGSNGKTTITLNTAYDLQYRMVLGEKSAQNPMEAVFTINGKAFPEIPPLDVRKGDKVKVTLVNEGSSDHPMHLHGHFFQILSKNGKPVTGAPMMKDTLVVRPGETYEVAFEADNPGEWMFHCHDLHHAAAGMVTSVMYNGHKPGFTPDPSVGNKPE